MCTAVTYQARDFYFGRTLDHTQSHGESVVVTPRRYPFYFRTAETVTDQLTFGSNVRAGAEYRARICRVLVRRALQSLNEQEG